MPKFRLQGSRPSTTTFASDGYDGGFIDPRLMEPITLAQLETNGVASPIYDTCLIDPRVAESTAAAPVLTEDVAGSLDPMVVAQSINALSYNVHSQMESSSNSAMAATDQTAMIEAEASHNYQLTSHYPRQYPPPYMQPTVLPTQQPSMGLGQSTQQWPQILGPHFTSLYDATFGPSPGELARHPVPAYFDTLAESEASKVHCLETTQHFHARGSSYELPG